MLLKPKEGTKRGYGLFSSENNFFILGIFGILIIFLFYITKKQSLQLLGSRQSVNNKLVLHFDWQLIPSKVEKMLSLTQTQV